MTERPPTGPGAPAPARRRLPSWATWLLGIGLGLVALIVAALLVIRQPRVATGLARAILARVHPLPRASLNAADVRGDLLTGLELRGVRLVRGDTLLASVDTLRARYDPASLLSGDFAVHELVVAGVRVTADIVDTTRTKPPAPRPPLTLADVLRGRFYGGPAFHVDRLAVRDGHYGGTFSAPDSGMRLTNVRLEVLRLRLGRGFSFEIDTLGVAGRSARQRGADVELGLAARLERGRFQVRSLRLRSDASTIDGGLVLGVGASDSLAEAEIELQARPLALADLEALIPGLALDGRVDANVSLHGPRANRLSGPVSLAADRVRSGDLELDDTRLDATFTDGRADTRVSLTSGGAHVTASGWLRPLDRSPAYDVEARTDRLPTRISGAPWWPAFAARVPATAVTLRAQGSGFARPAASVTGRVTGDAGTLDLDGRVDLTRDVTWEVRRLAFDGVDVARLAGDTTASAASGVLVASGEATASKSRRMTARLDLEPSHYGTWQLTSGRARVRLAGDNVGGSLSLDTNVGGLSVDSLAGRWDAAGTLRLLGARFHDVDLEGITRQPALASRLDGSLRGTVHGLGALGSAGGAGIALRQGRTSGELRLDLEPSRFHGQDITGGTVQLKVARGGVDVTGAIESAAGRVELAARGRPFDVAPSYELTHGQFADVDLAAWTGSAGLRSSLSGTVSGEGRPGVTPGSSGTWETTLHLAASSIAGASLDGGDARASWSEGRTSLSAALRAAGDTVSARADLVVHDQTAEGNADVSVPIGVLAALAGRDSLRASGRLAAHATFAGLAPATATADGAITGAGAVDQVRLDSLFAGFHLRQGTLTLDTLLARSNVAEAAGAGRVALFDTTSAARSDLHVAFAVNDVAPLKALLRADTLKVDTATVVLAVRGSGKTRSFDVRSTVASLTWNNIRLLGSDGNAQGELDASWRLTRAHAEATLRRLYGIGMPVNQAVARADFDAGRTQFDLEAIRDEFHRLHLTGKALSDSLGQHVTLERMDLRSDSASWALSHPARLSFRPARFEIDGFDLRSADGRIEANGVIDRRGEQTFRLTMSNVGLEAIGAWIGRPDVTGTLDGRLALDGPAAAPRGSGDIQLGLTTEGKPAATVRSRLAWNGTRLDFGGSFATPKQDSLTWTGSLPFAVSLAANDSGKTAAPMRVLEGDVDVALRADHFPLAAFSPLLDPHSVGEMDGVLDLDARLRGSSRAIVGEGRIDVNGGVVPLPALGVTYRSLEVHGAFQGDRLRLDKAHATSEKGSLDASGELRFVGVTRVEPKLHVESRQFVFVQSPDLRAIASGSIDITGTLTSLVVKGKATILNSSFYLTPPEANAGEPGATVQLTEADVRMLQENFGDVKTSAPNAVMQLYDASDLDLAVTLERNNWVRQRVRPKMSVALTGDFRLKKAPHGEPQMFGRIEPIARRGYVEEFARSFDIAGGEVLLNGPMTDHRVDIQAEYKPPTSESDENTTIIKLDVEGTIEKLSLTLSSEPPMSEVEIVNYIATGHSAADKSSTSSQESSSLAKDIGLSQVSGFAEEAAQEAIGLDVLQVRFDALQGATLVAGRYLDSQLYVGFRQPLQYKENGSSTSGEQQRTSFEVEYAVYQWLVLNLQGETAKLRSFIRARHAY